ncbi:hypothetical protein [Mesorhizobium sp. M2E.F.Ca.ET.209.01.1.1]|uniref:hypothetical protein n=1 Tax=Mesorhizobium sp. M2E.F.Ca.ET.209.01.1.1 TaxID=2500526 RepID=UPI001676711F|nr:hypothetical protein [Mesorhizobium sp. M2E.F.Ca.ET.209.01.1.1]
MSPIYRFDLDDVGTHVGQILGACGTLQEMAKADDLDPAEHVSSLDVALSLTLFVKSFSQLFRALSILFSGLFVEKDMWRPERICAI